MHKWESCTNATMSPSLLTSYYSELIIGDLQLDISRPNLGENNILTTVTLFNLARLLMCNASIHISHSMVQLGT